MNQSEKETAQKFENENFLKFVKDTKTRIDELEYKLTCEQVKFASLIQTIENRITELEEKLKVYCTYEVQYLIIEAQIKENKNLLTLIKS